MIQYAKLLILSSIFFLSSCSVRNDADFRELRSLPLKTDIQVEANGDVSASRVTFGLGSYGVTDIGRIRLVLQNLPQGGNGGSGQAMLKCSEEHMFGAGDATGTGKSRFQSQNIKGGGQFTFGSIEFSIIDCVFHYKDYSVSATNSPILIFIDEAGDIIETYNLPTGPTK